MRPEALNLFQEPVSWTAAPYRVVGRHQRRTPGRVRGRGKRTYRRVNARSCHETWALSCLSRPTRCRTWHCRFGSTIRCNGLDPDRARSYGNSPGPVRARGERGVNDDQRGTISLRLGSKPVLPVSRGTDPRMADGRRGSDAKRSAAMVGLLEFPARLPVVEIPGVHPNAPCRHRSRRREGRRRPREAASPTAGASSIARAAVDRDHVFVQSLWRASPHALSMMTSAQASHTHRS